MKTLDELKNELYSQGLSAYFDALAPFARNSIRITLDHQEEDNIPLGACKFGGRPDLPAGVEWACMAATGVPLSFIAQINFAEIAPYDLEHKLPERGMLYFFYDCSPDGMPWGFDPKDADGWKVLFCDAEPAALSRKDAPADPDEDEENLLFGSARMCFEAVMELPCTDSDLVRNLELPDDDELEDQYYEWREDAGSTLCNKILGHADTIQSGMELECEYVTHNIYCGTPEGYKIAKARGLDKNAAHWTLLLQVDSNEDLGMEWGDMGRLYLWITDEDLAARRFENSWLILQCG